MKARQLIAAPLLLGLALLGACTESAPEPSPTPEVARVPALPALDVNPQPREALTAGGELRIGVPALPKSLNPLGTGLASGDLQSVNRAMFPTFFDVAEDGSISPNPNFVTSAQVTASSPTTVSLKLHPKAVWGDGAPITAADVIATVNACSGKSKDFQCATTAGFDQVASIKAGADEFEVLLAYRGEFADWTLPFRTVGTLRADSVRSASVFNGGWNTIPARWTTGPFVAGGVDASTQAVAAVANSRWWGDSALLERITWRAVAPKAQVRAFNERSIDAFVGADAPTSLAGLDAAVDPAVRTALGPQVRMLAMNTGGALTDAATRTALAGVLDRMAVAQRGLEGLNFPAVAVNNHVFATTDPAYRDEAATRALPERSAAAATLSAKRLRLRLTYRSGDPVAEGEAREISNQLQEAGVRVSLTPAKDYANALAGREFDLIVTDQGPTAYPFALDSRYGRGQAGNLYGNPPAAVSDALTRLRETADPGPRTEAAGALAERLWEQMYGVPLYQRPVTVVAPAGVANFGATGVATLAWENVGYVA